LIGENGMEIGKIRECGVYLLPDGRELIASGSGGFFKLYDPLAWKYLGPPLYEIRDAMRLTCFGRPTPWSVHDLIDKRQTAPLRPQVFGKSA
jgi:hypothetical protein